MFPMFKDRLCSAHGGHADYEEIEHWHAGVVGGGLAAGTLYGNGIGDPMIESLPPASTPRSALSRVRTLAGIPVSLVDTSGPEIETPQVVACAVVPFPRSGT